MGEVERGGYLCLGDEIRFLAAEQVMVPNYWSKQIWVKNINYSHFRPNILPDCTLFSVKLTIPSTPNFSFNFNGNAYDGDLYFQQRRGDRATYF